MISCGSLPCLVAFALCAWGEVQFLHKGSLIIIIVPILDVISAILFMSWEIYEGLGGCVGVGEDVNYINIQLYTLYT